MKVYALFDRKVGEHGALVVATTDEAVVRGLKEGLPRDSTPGRYPEDFDLTCVGEFDAVSGALSGLPRPRVVSNLSAILVKEESNAQR